MEQNKIEEMVETLSKKYGKNYEVEDFIHEGLNSAEHLSHFVQDIRQALQTIDQQAREEERQKFEEKLEWVFSLEAGEETETRLAVFKILNDLQSLNTQEEV